MRNHWLKVCRGIVVVTCFVFGAYSNFAQAPAQRQVLPGKLVWVDRKGVQMALPTPTHPYRCPRISPDGKRVAFSLEELGGQVWIYDFAAEKMTRLTAEGTTSNLYPAWTPDGKHVAFESGSPEGNLFWQAVDGTSAAERLYTSQYPEAPSSWSPNGRDLAFWESNPTTSRDIWILHLADRTRELFLQTPSSEAAARFSPDGRWLAYTTNESGRSEIVVRPYPGSGEKSQVSDNGGTEPVWSSTGRELFYREGNTKMMAVDITTKGGFSTSKPKMLFEGPYLLNPAGTVPNYDVASDDKRFLMIQQVEQKP
jgi:eukaryotic-like serine/threonine-protein kinase